MSHYDYPVEQLARSRSTRFQMGFARMTMHLLPELPDVMLEASSKGLRIHAASEIALALPEEIIRQIHAGDVEFSEPRPRTVYVKAPREPVMCVRASVPRSYAEPVLHDLIGRAAEIDEVDWLAPLPTIRAKAALRNLIGYPAALAALSNNMAELQMWLSHYAPVPPEPAGAA